MGRRPHRRALAALGIGIAAGLASACGSSSSSAGATQPSPTAATATTVQVGRCAPHGAHVIAASHGVVVYTVPRLLHAGRAPSSPRPGVAIFGCLVANGRPVPLGAAPRVDRIALNGSVVAYATTEAMGIDTTATRVAVADIRRGRVLFSVPAGRIAIAPRSVSVDAIAVTPNHTVAWIQHGGTLQSPGYSVHMASLAKPSGRQVASGTAISPHSLQLTSATVSWVEGEQRRSASI